MGANMYMKRSLLFLLFAAMALAACTPQRRLPIYGERKLASAKPGAVPDTVYQTIPPFSFTDQTGATVSQADFDGKVYVADFFFTRCPSICPIMSRQMLRVYNAYKSDPRLLLLSHSIDPKHDSVAVLKRYADGLGIQVAQWHLVTGPKDAIYEQAQKGYIVPAVYGTGLPQDINHSGHFVLVDGQRRIRGYYLGTDAAEVDKLIADIKILLAE
jgi:protein SCO1/2